jgi:hypothetical protein
MSKSVIGPDGQAFEFPDNMSNADIERVLASHYRSLPATETKRSMTDTAMAKANVPEVKPRSLGQRFGDDFYDGVSRSALIAQWRANFIRPEIALRSLLPLGVRPLVEGAPEKLEKPKDFVNLLSAGVATSAQRHPFMQFLGTMGAGTGLVADAIRPGTRKEVRDLEVQRRVAFAKASAEDPWYGVEGVGNKALHGAAALGSTLLSAAADPTSYATGGQNVVARMGVQALAAGGGDVLTQGFDQQAGIQTDYDVGQTVAAAATGAAFTGLTEVGGKALKAGFDKLRGKPVDIRAPVEAHFKDALDADDLINEAPLTYREIRSAKPEPDHFQWYDPADAGSMPKISEPGKMPADMFGNLPSPLLAKVKKNIAELGDAIPVEKTEAFARWMREGGTETPKWIDFDKIADKPERLEALSDMLKEMFDDAYKIAGKERVHFDDVVERAKSAGISVDDAIIAHAGITGERGLSTALQTMQVVSDAHFARLDEVLSTADAVINDARSSEGQINDAMAEVSKHMQLATLLDAQLRGAKSEVARTLAFMRQQKDRSQTLNQLDAYTKEIFGNELSLKEKRELVTGMRSAYRREGSRGARQAIRKLNAMGPLDLIDFWSRGSMLSSPDVIVNNIVSTGANIEFDIWMEGSLRAAVATAGRLFDRDSVNLYSFRQALVTNREYRISLARNFAAGLAKFATDQPGIWREIGEYVGGPTGPRSGIGDTLNRINYYAAYLPNHAIDGLFRKSIRSAQIAGFASERAYQLSKRWAAANTRENRVQMNDVYTKTYNAIVEEPTAEAIQAAQKFFDTKDLTEARDKYLFGSSDVGDLHLAVMEGMNVRAFADDAALKLTFNNKNALASKFNVLIRHNAATRVVGNLAMPFVRTPLNVMQATWRIAPGITQADAMVKVVQKLVKQEEVIFKSPEAWTEYMGRQFASMSLLAIAAPLFSNGLITGNTGLGVDKRNTNSIKIGDTWHKYSDLGAFGQMLSVIASVYEVATADENERGDAVKLATKVATASMSSFMTNSVFRGLNDLLNNAIDGEDKTQQLLKYVSSQIAGRIPFTAAASWVDKEIDPAVKETYDDDFLKSVGNAIATRWPGMDGYLPDKLDIFGREIERSRLPRSIQVNDLDDLEEELLNLSRVNGDKFRPPARRFNDEPISGKEYQTLLRLQGQYYRDPDTGLNMEEALNQLIRSKAYADYTWQQKGIAVREMINDYRSAANLEIKNPESPFYMEEMVKRTGADALAKMWKPDDTEDDFYRRGYRKGFSDEELNILKADPSAYQKRNSDAVWDSLIERKD